VLAEEWGRDIRTTMGLAKHGYPNLRTVAACQAARPTAQWALPGFNTCAGHEPQTDTTVVVPTSLAATVDGQELAAVGG
jgi:acetone monooxygenase